MWLPTDRLARIAVAAREHPGADHVVIMPVATDDAKGIDILERLGSALDASSW